MRKSLIKTNFLPLILCLALWPASPAFCAGADPVVTLQRIANAVEMADADTFDQLVDVDGILDSALTLFLAEASKPENASRLSPMFALMLSQAEDTGTQGQLMRGMLKKEAREFVMNGIRSGAFAGKKITAAQQSGLLAPLFAEASIGRKEIREIGKPVADGNGWLVPFVVHDFGNNLDYAIVGRFTPGDGDFRLTSIQNIDQILARIQKENLNNDQNP